VNKLVEEAPYHPGYEDAVVTPTPKYIGMDPAKMIWKQKPLSDEEIEMLAYKFNLLDDFPHEFVRAIEERHGIK
jgi:hypothetical protein